MTQQVKIWLGSWNCGGRSPSKADVLTWLNSAKKFQPHIVVIGQQEADGAAHKKLHKIKEGQGYKLVDSVSMGGFVGGGWHTQYLSVLVHSSKLATLEGSGSRQRRVKKVKRYHSGSGVRTAGVRNKGGCASVIEYWGAKLAFVTVHLESKDPSGEKRKEEVGKLFQQVKKLAKSDKRDNQAPHLIFVMGDLNFRLDPPVQCSYWDMIDKLMDPIGLEEMYQWDTLRRANRGGRVFPVDGEYGGFHFAEPRVSPCDRGQLWLPTYKRKKPKGGEPYSQQIALSKADPKRFKLKEQVRATYFPKVEGTDVGWTVERNPKRGGEIDLGWLDRVGWSLNVLNPVTKVQEWTFGSCPKVSASDHCPVWLQAQFEILDPVLKAARKRVALQRELAQVLGQRGGPQ